MPHSWKSHDRSAGSWAGSQPALAGDDPGEGGGVVGADPVEIDAEDEGALSHRVTAPLRPATAGRRGGGGR